MLLLAIAVVLMPLMVVLFYYMFDELKDITLTMVWQYAQLITFVIFLLGGLFGYLRMVRPYQQDLKYTDKTIEQVHVLQKKFMPQNKSFHVFIPSDVRMSVEVNETFFNQIQPGDEMSIEYSRYGEIYLGYF